MRVVFAGTPEFAVPSLRALDAAGHILQLVLTQPDRPAGRGMAERTSPVKQAAQALGVPLYQPVRLGGDESLARLRAAAPEVMVVVAYGLILPKAVLDLPPRGAINVHASLLPRWRGAAPIQRAILAGDRETGISLMQMDAGLDTGPILAQDSTPIADADTGGSVHDRLAELGAAMLVHALHSGETLSGRPQPATGVTYARKITKAETLVDWALAADVVARTIRAFDPTPGAATTLGEASLKLWRATPLAGLAGAAPGTILRIDDALHVACGEGSLAVTEAQRPGGRRLPIAELLRGWPLHPGRRFSSA
jgi:methionyl-tRNA formyltransferase